MQPSRFCRLICFFLTTILITSQTGCGQTGPLYLPKPLPSPAKSCNGQS